MKFVVICLIAVCVHQLVAGKKGKKNTAESCDKDHGDCMAGVDSGRYQTLLPGMEQGERLDRFINRLIRPNEDFNRRSKEVIDRLVRSLQESSGAFKSKVKGIIKSGSLGKGTHLRDRSDIDLIIFYNGYSSVSELQADKKRLLQKLKEHVQREFANNFRYQTTTPFSVQFTMTLERGGAEHEVDLLPALDITKTGQSLSSIYGEMKQLEAQARAPYSSCLAPLQVDFVHATGGMSTPGRVKDLILVMKYWAKEDKVPVRSYFLELVVVRLWREAGKPTSIDMESSLRQILQQLVDIKSMGVAFPDNYNYKDYVPKQKKPFLLDPANPFRNVAPTGKDVEVVVKRAKEFLARMS